MSHSALQRLTVLPQYFVPQHALSRAAGCLADSTWPAIKNPMIDFFIQRYGIDMNLAAEPSPHAYASFNDFFTRALKDGIRPITEADIASPADGAISQIGQIEQEKLFQAKGHYYTLNQLLGGDENSAQHFKNGHFATIYLSPKDYHRVHMPVTGTLKKMIYVPGRLFSVNTLTAQNVPSLFARNERVICLFDTELGPMAVILVGAMIVASIETVWAGLITPPKRQLKQFTYPQAEEIRLEKGEEMGRFKLGSTVIVLFGENVVNWTEDLKEQSPVVMGQTLGEANPNRG